VAAAGVEVEREGILGPMMGIMRTRVTKETTTGMKDIDHSLYAYIATPVLKVIQGVLSSAVKYHYGKSVVSCCVRVVLKLLLSTAFTVKLLPSQSAGIIVGTCFNNQ